MSSGITAVIIVVVIIVIALIIAMTMAARRRRLQQQFGDEYDRILAEKESRREAESELAERQRRVRKYHIRPLSPESRSRYQGEWQAIQEQFVDSPQTAVTEAYSLVTTVMQERGYPPADDEQAADDLSVEHADTIGHFRSAQTITKEAAHGSVATEDLRQAFIHYRELFAELLGDAATDEEAVNGSAAAQAIPPAGRHHAPAAEPITDDATEEPVAATATDPDGQPMTARYLDSDAPYMESDASRRQ